MEARSTSRRLGLGRAWKMLTHSTGQRSGRTDGKADLQACSPLDSASPTRSELIYELDATEDSWPRPTIPSPAASSAALQDLATPLPEPYMEEPFLVPFNLFSYNEAGHVPFVELTEQKLWEIPNRKISTAQSWLCARCLAVRLLPMKLLHWGFDEMINSIQSGCNLCNFFYINGLRDRYLSQVQTWYQREKAYVVVRPSAGEISFVFGSLGQPSGKHDTEYKLFERTFELYRIRGVHRHCDFGFRFD
jgi:hypothetical protein